MRMNWNFKLQFNYNCSIIKQTNKTTTFRPSLIFDSIDNVIYVIQYDDAID